MDWFTSIRISSFAIFGHHLSQESSCLTLSSWLRTYTHRKMTDGTIARKPKRSPLAKQFRKWNNYFAGMALPFARYAPIPSKLFYERTVMYTLILLLQIRNSACLGNLRIVLH